MQVPKKFLYFSLLASSTMAIGMLQAVEVQTQPAPLPKMEKVEQPAIPVPKPDVPPADPSKPVELNKPVEPEKPIDKSADVSKEGPIKVELTQEYKNDKGYAIKFPKDWEMKEGFMGLDVFALSPLVTEKDMFRENVNLVTEDLTKPLTLAEYYKLGTDNLKTLLTDFKEEGSGDVTLADGVTGKWIVYEHRMGEIKAKVLQYIFVKENRAYIITFTAAPGEFEKYRPAFEEIEKTFQLTGKK